MPQSFDTTIARSVPPMARHRDIACRDIDPELFFPGPGEHPAVALAACHRCPHQDECLTWALDTGQAFGVFGGKTAAQRARLTRREDA